MKYPIKNRPIMKIFPEQSHYRDCVQYLKGKIRRDHSVFTQKLEKNFTNTQETKPSKLIPQYGVPAVSTIVPHLKLKKSKLAVKRLVELSFYLIRLYWQTFPLSKEVKDIKNWVAVDAPHSPEHTCCGKMGSEVVYRKVRSDSRK